jgi:uncharacterized protein (DUF362 family)
LADSIDAGKATRPVSVVGVPRESPPEVVEAAVRRAAEAVSDFRWLSRGDRVLIKPVCNSPNPYPATTDPIALHAMIRLLRERGAGQITVADMSGVQFVRFSPERQRGSSRKLMTSSGMASAIDEADARLHAFEESGWDAFHPEEPTGGSRWSTPVMMPDVLNETDHVVLMPRCARHILAGSTLGLKSAVGWWRHDSRLLYHREGASLPEKTAEANRVPSLLAKQRLVLTSATKVMTTFGPDTGHVVTPDTGLIIASASVVAHDMVSLAWLHENRRVTPSNRRDKLSNDPHRSPLIRGVINRFVTSILGGGVGDVLRTETPPAGTTGSIWNDRFLKGGFESFGEIPKLALVDGAGSVPAALMQSLSSAVQPRI